MIWGLSFGAGLLIVAMLSGLWIKLLPSTFGIALFFATFFPGIFILISLLVEASDGRIRSLSDAKKAVVDGGTWFLRWAFVMFCALAIAGIGFVFTEFAPSM